MVGDEEPDAEGGKPAEGKPGKRKKKKKLKSAWIGFFGRILAQVVGAAATVGLGIMLVRSQMVTPTPPAPSATPTPRAIGQQRSVEEIFALFDANRDDRLAPAEVPAEMWPRLSRADTNGDGFVSSAELREARARAIPPPGKR
jgi:hypothetical protein